MLGSDRMWSSRGRAGTFPQTMNAPRIANDFPVRLDDAGRIPAEPETAGARDLAPDRVLAGTDARRSRVAEAATR